MAEFYKIVVGGQFIKDLVGKAEKTKPAPGEEKTNWTPETVRRRIADVLPVPTYGEGRTRAQLRLIDKIEDLVETNVVGDASPYITLTKEQYDFLVKCWEAFNGWNPTQTVRLFVREVGRIIDEAEKITEDDVRESLKKGEKEKEVAV